MSDNGISNTDTPTADATTNAATATGSALQDAYRQWSESATAVLAKSRRVSADELPGSPEELLSTNLPGSLTVRPLYTRRDELPESSLPGEFPYVRGSDADRDPIMGWRVTERFGDPSSPRDPGAINDAIIDALENGASGLWLSVGTDGIALDDLPAALDGVLFDLVPVTVDAGVDGVAAARTLLDLLPDEHRPTVSTVISLGLAPLTSAYSTRPDVDLAAAVDIAHRAGTRARALRVDGTDFAAAGATDVAELAFSVAAGVDYLRALTDSGLSPEQALGQLTFALGASDDQFLSIAKFRALRRLWARVADVVGAPAAGGAVTHAVTTIGMFSQRDAWVNMLRSTVAAFGAGVGGADQVTVLGFDAALPLEARTSSPAFSRRMARNTQLLLLEESNLGRVLDPAGGSWFVESLTDDVAHAAWALFQTVEGHGGYRAALERGFIAEQIAESLAERDRAIAHRTVPLTGISEFPNLDERPLVTSESATSPNTPVAPAPPNLVRTAHQFEELRDASDRTLAEAGARPTVVLVPLGPVAEHNGRTTFVANLLAAGGIAAVNPGPLRPEEIADAVAAAGDPSVAVLCAANPRYREEGSAALQALRDAGVTTVHVAGPASAWPSDEPAPDDFVGIGVDAIDTLTSLQQLLGVGARSGAGAANRQDAR
ncbi:methylmalonyl-CoA mutase family protein [Williamsia maris]|uniref:Methylmalonyl-CoA mutase n=1 Tax=Williamsia maris TaxID=72806 RepID=A0ABT1HK72_9NOCA|nr:methylmalonyl-CoA mutase family protein [Williamsia maris]MCP2178289.1 methylmalonyl-CoA mutase [Williamsia maris]